MHYTLPQLIALDERYPTQRKLLLVPSINFGRELLAALAHARGSWVGWEVATLASIAQKLALVVLAERSVRRASDVAIADHVGVAFEQAASNPGFSPELAALTWSTGTRGAIVDAILELRTAGATVEMLRALGSAGVASSLAMILERYERLLRQRHHADSAEVFRAAVEAFDDEKQFVLDHPLTVGVPGWSARGLPGKLFLKLADHGLTVLKTPSLEGVSSPKWLAESMTPSSREMVEPNGVNHSGSMFCAATPLDELREIVRRIASQQRRVDEVEIVVTDRDAYGGAIEALSVQLEVSYTSVDGLSFTSTRIGRALERWFSWIESDYSATIIRDALESGDWQVTEGGATVVGAGLAAELRRLRIGWGIDATQRAADFLATPKGREVRPHAEDETKESVDARRAARARDADALGHLLHTLVNESPATVGQSQSELDLSGDAAPGARIGLGELAQKTSRILVLIDPHGPAERATLQRLSERLTEISSVRSEPTTVPNALAALRQELASLRAWTNSSKTTRPRRATGGHLHVTNIESAGATGRPFLYFVGLDADRTTGPVLQGPLLPDFVRARLNERGAQLPTIEQRRRERAWQLALALRGSNANVSMSFALRSEAGGRETSPAPVLLEELRRVKHDANATYADLLAYLGEPVSPVPPQVEHAIDERDAVLAHMTDGPLMLDANDVIRNVRPGINRGLNAHAARADDKLGAYHGLVPDAGIMDPRRSGRPISPSALESLAGCSLRWFYSHALNARVEEELVSDPMVWLNVLDRGTVLHSIYERIVRERLYENEPSDSQRAETLRIVHEVADEWSRKIPAPGSAVQSREILALENEAHLFVSSEHNAFRKAPWTVVDVEIEFGGKTGREATFVLDDGTTLNVRGRVDRVDRLADGTLRLVDYKTGRSFVLDTKRGAFDGGRKLQLAVYSPAISAMFDAVVSAAEYYFPTKRGNAVVARADRELLDVAPRVVRTLLDDVAAGRFVATVDPKDCAYCEYGTICRVKVGMFGAAESPRARHAAEQLEASPHYEGVRIRRRRAGEDT